jgi:hypothetical protein
MAIEQFALPISPAEGLGFHEHWMVEGGVASRFHPHRPNAMDGRWTLGTAWTCLLEDSLAPSIRGGYRWFDSAYQPITPEWQGAAPRARQALESGAGDALYLRQTIEAGSDTVALYLELLTERAVELYLNGELICKLEALVERPPAWQSAGGSYTISSPLLHLGLNQRLVGRGRNVLALRVGGRLPVDREGEEYIAYRSLVRD